MEIVNAAKILHERFGWPPEKIGYLVGVSRQAVDNWLADRHEPLPAMQRKLQKLLERERRKEKEKEAS